MFSLPNPLVPAYRRHAITFGDRLLGVMLIGSRAHGEAIDSSDYDLRLVVDTSQPLLRFDEMLWTDPGPDRVTLVGWEALNHDPAISFGLTNLAFIAQMLLHGRFPLPDHTCLYQGQLLYDPGGRISAFRERHRQTVFANIVPDSIRQTAWRVTGRLVRERAALTTNLDARKLAVPALHTCTRVVRDLAQIASYQTSGQYLAHPGALAQYYHQRWPWFGPTFAALRAYKTDAVVRRQVFERLAQDDPAQIALAQAWITATVQLWTAWMEHTG